MSLLPFFQWVSTTTLSQAISASSWAFAVTESMHLLALAVIGGAVLIVDMRLAGFGLRQTPASQVARDAEPWLIWSLLVMLVSGFMLMTSEAMRCYYNGAFWLKMWSLLFAMIFTFTIRRRVALKDAVAPITAKIVAFVSILLWSGVGLGGRGIGFY